MAIRASTTPVGLPSESVKKQRSKAAVEAFKIAKRTEGLARTFSQYAMTKAGYNRVFLVSKKGRESAGIVDLIGVRKMWNSATKRLDDAEIVLIQVNGNKRVSSKEKLRLLEAMKRVRVKAGIIEYTRGKQGELEIIGELPIA